MTSIDFGSLVLGGNTFGWTADRAESFAVLDAFVAAGGRAIDTADVYSAWVPGHVGGESETIIGEWMASRGNRDGLVIGTKVFQLASRPGLSSANIHAAIDDSLTRLRTDHVDVYYAHRDDPDVPQEEYVAAFHDLVVAGKVREVGVSEFTPDRIRSAVAVAKRNGLTPITVSQDQYSLVHREPEDEKLGVLAELGIVEVPFWVLAAGFLTGKYRPDVVVDSQRADGAGAYVNDPVNIALLDRLDAVAARHSVSVAAVAIAWIRQQPGVAAPIASARVIEQLPALLESTSVSLSAEELVELSEG